MRLAGLPSCPNSLMSEILCVLAGLTLLRQNITMQSNFGRKGLIWFTYSESQSIERSQDKNSNLAELGRGHGEVLLMGSLLT